MDKHRKLISDLEDKSMQFFNYSNNDSAFGYNAAKQFFSYHGNTAFGYDADALNYDADALNFNNGASDGSKWTQEKIASANLTTFKCRVVWALAAGGATSNPVDVVFFRSAFNTGTFDGSGNLVFTNAAGNTATIRGLTVSMQTLMNITETEPFTIAFARISPKSVTQLDNPMTILKNTQWKSGAFNDIEPDTYIDTYQTQTLRVDVPFNIQVDKKRGFSWTIDPDQTVNGCGITFFVSSTFEPTKALQDKPAVRNLGNGANTFYTPNMPAAQLRQDIMIKEIGAHPMVQSAIAAHTAAINAGAPPPPLQPFVRNLLMNRR